MSGFQDRLRIAGALENAFIEEFNSICTTWKIVKFGIEATNLAHVHKMIRKRYDQTSKFLRYLPDSVVVAPEKDDGPVHLIEFKVAQTGIKKDSFLQKIARNCPDMSPPFGHRHDVFNIESEALDGYLQLAKIGVSVIVVGTRHLEQITLCGRSAPPGSRSATSTIPIRVLERRGAALGSRM